jgi:hypothetical protein
MPPPPPADIEMLTCLDGVLSYMFDCGDMLSSFVKEARWLSLRM